MNVCGYVCAWVCTCVCACVCMHMYVLCEWPYIFGCVFVPVYLGLYVHVWVCMCACMCVCVCVCACICKHHRTPMCLVNGQSCLCVCVWCAYTHTRKHMHYIGTQVKPWPIAELSAVPAVLPRVIKPPITPKPPPPPIQPALFIPPSKVHLRPRPQVLWQVLSISQRAAANPPPPPHPPDDGAGPQPVCLSACLPSRTWDESGDAMMDQHPSPTWGLKA